MVIVVGAVFAFGFQQGRAAQPVPATPDRLYQLLEAKGTRTIEFADGGWAYHVETPTRDKLYIAGVKGPGTQAQAVAAFNGNTAAKTADLMIVVCGSEFGDDGCDFYSPLHEVPRNGESIRGAGGAMQTYQTIVAAAAVAAGGSR
jgi:hypothetical protein